VIASVVAGHLSHIIIAPQSRDKTLPYYFGLPRDRTTAWTAQVAFIVCAILWMECVILAGTLIQLGGAGMTPIYRLHPESFAFPFLVASCVLVCMNSGRYVWWFLLSLLILGISFAFWSRVNLWNYGDTANNFLPDRKFSLWLQYVFAVFLMTTSGFVLYHSRRHWQMREVGEIV
jgi:hypothetical protein